MRLLLKATDTGRRKFPTGVTRKGFLDEVISYWKETDGQSLHRWRTQKTRPFLKKNQLNMWLEHLLRKGFFYRSSQGDPQERYPGKSTVPALKKGLRSSLEQGKHISFLEGEIKDRARRPHPNTRGESRARRRHLQAVSLAVTRRGPNTRQGPPGPGGRGGGGRDPQKGRTGPTNAGGGESLEGSPCFGPPGP